MVPRQMQLKDLEGGMGCRRTDKTRLVADSIVDPNVQCKHVLYIMYSLQVRMMTCKVFRALTRQIVE